MSLQGALEAMDRRSFDEYKSELRAAERRQRTPKEIPAERLGFGADDPGYPLGRGMPPGSTLRKDGESHRDAWMRVVRGDPCSFCGRPAGRGAPCRYTTAEDWPDRPNTVDHIEPRSKPARGIGGAHTWLNFAAACESCNAGKKDGDLLRYLRARQRSVRRQA